MNINGHRHANIILHRWKGTDPSIGLFCVAFYLKFLVFLAAASITMVPISMLYMQVIFVNTSRSYVFS